MGRDDRSHCRGCGQEIYWGMTDNGKRAPFNLDDTNHFSTCPNRDEFRGSSRIRKEDDPQAFMREKMPEAQCFFDLEDKNPYRLRLKKNKK